MRSEACKLAAVILIEDPMRAECAGVIAKLKGQGFSHIVMMTGDSERIAISEGAEIARQIADITISSEDLNAIVVLRELSTLLMKRIRFNYGTIVGFNSALILLGVAGILPPATSAMLHNGSTVALGLKSMTNLLPE